MMVYPSIANNGRNDFMHQVQNISIAHNHEVNKKIMKLIHIYGAHFEEQIKGKIQRKT